MRIICCGCTHGSELDLKIPSGDILIHTGDYTGVDSLAELPRLNRWFGLQPHPIKLFVPGNHDRAAEDSLGIFKIMLSNAHVLLDEEVIIQGLKFFGSPWQTFYNNWAFNIGNPKERAKLFKRIPRDTNILITHCPPYSILDNGLGDMELAKRIMKLKDLRYHIFSHIHGAYGVHEQDGITFVNCSILDDTYRVIHDPVILEVLHSAESI